MDNIEKNSNGENAEVISISPTVKKKVFAKKERVESKRKGYQDTKGNRNKLKVMFFGGVGEVGKNMTALCYGDDILVIDCGVAFPDDDMLGVDLVIPDMTYLKNNAQKIKGILITHAHEDHIGSLPYFLDTVKAPVYASRLTLAMIQGKLREFPKVKMVGKVVKPKDVVKIGCFQVEFIHVNHSIAGAHSLAIKTPVGLVVHSGDFKIDFTPLLEETTDLSRFGELGQRGVLLYLGESTNAEFEGFSLSEKVVKETLHNLFEQYKDKRLILTVFASNVHRMQQIMYLAKEFKRKIAFAGRSMINNMEVAMKVGEVVFDKDIIVDIAKAKNLKPEETLILSTGSQGQESTALARMARGEFQGLTLGENDVVIFSSSPVPGNEKAVSGIINDLIEKGITVIYNDLASVHASGHACKGEDRIMHKLLKPKYFVPVHGEAKHQLAHKRLAMELGMKENNIFIPHNGSVLEVTPQGVHFTQDVQAGESLVDGLGMGQADSNVLKERKQLSTEGLCVVVIGINMKKGEIVSGPEMIAKGFIYSHEAQKVIDEAKGVLMKALEKIDIKNTEWNDLKGSIKSTLTNLFYRRIERKPIIIPIVMDIEK